MSYCRFSNADAYIYEAEEGFTCCGCRIAESGMFVCETELEMIEHIAQHRKAGHFVPTYVDDMLRDEVSDYIATLEAEVEALRPYRDGYDPKERLPEVNKYEPDTSVNVDALILTASGVVFWGTLYYHFGKKEWLGIRDNMVILRWYPELPYSESEVRNE
jgi:hypothetical protein